MRAGGRAVGWRGWGHTLDFRTAHFRPNRGPCQSSTPPYSWRARTFGDPRLLLSLPHPRTSRCPSCPLSFMSRGGLITRPGRALVLPRPPLIAVDSCRFLGKGRERRERLRSSCADLRLESCANTAPEWAKARSKRKTRTARPARCRSLNNNNNTARPARADH